VHKSSNFRGLFEFDPKIARIFYKLKSQRQFQEVLEVGTTTSMIAGDEDEQ